MFKCVEEMFKWTSCSEDCELDVYRCKLPLRESLACCIWDRIHHLVRRLSWNVLYQYADAVQLGQYNCIDDVISEIKEKYGCKTLTNFDYSFCY